MKSISWSNLWSNTRGDNDALPLAASIPRWLQADGGQGTVSGCDYSPHTHCRRGSVEQYGQGRWSRIVFCEYSSWVPAPPAAHPQIRCSGLGGGHVVVADGTGLRATDRCPRPDLRPRTFVWVHWRGGVVKFACSQYAARTPQRCRVSSRVSGHWPSHWNLDSESLSQWPTWCSRCVVLVTRAVSAAYSLINISQSGCSNQTTWHTVFDSSARMWSVAARMTLSLLSAHGLTTCWQSGHISLSSLTSSCHRLSSAVIDPDPLRARQVSDLLWMPPHPQSCTRHLAPCLPPARGSACRGHHTHWCPLTPSRLDLMVRFVRRSTTGDDDTRCRGVGDDGHEMTDCACACGMRECQPRLRRSLMSRGFGLLQEAFTTLWARTGTGTFREKESFLMVCSQPMVQWAQVFSASLCKGGSWEGGAASHRLLAVTCRSGLGRQRGGVSSARGSEVTDSEVRRRTSLSSLLSGYLQRAQGWRHLPCDKQDLKSGTRALPHPSCCRR